METDIIMVSDTKSTEPNPPEAGAPAAEVPEAGAPAAAAETSPDVPSDLAERVAALEQHPGRTDFQSWTAVVTLLALAIYGAARFGDTAFYARLGTDADTVGLNYGVTLARVATTVAVASAGVLALFLFGRLRAKPQNERNNQGPLSKLFSAVGFVIASALSILLLILIIPPVLVPIGRLRLLTGLACAAALYLAGYRYEKARRQVNSFSRIRFTIAGAIAVVLMFGLAAVTGYHSAGEIMQGRLLPCPCVRLFGHNITLPWSSGTNGFLGIKAEEATVTWLGRGKRTVPRSAILLGGSNDSVVLYDTLTQTTLIVPVQDVIVEPFSNLTGWNEK
jgi:hypothetical protein